MSPDHMFLDKAISSHASSPIMQHLQHLRIADEVPGPEADALSHDTAGASAIIRDSHDLHCPLIVRGDHEHEPKPASEPELPMFLKGAGATLRPELLLDSMQHIRKVSELLPVFERSLRRNIITAEHTLPCITAHGLGTWYICRQGELGVAWLRNCDAEQMEMWLTDPHAFRKGEDWRFIKLHPSDTVYLEPGTVHFLFCSSPIEQFVFDSGLILRNSSVKRWINVLEQELRYSVAHDECVTPHPFRTVSPWPRSEYVNKLFLIGLSNLLTAACHNNTAFLFGLTEKGLFKTQQRIRLLVSLLESRIVATSARVLQDPAGAMRVQDQSGASNAVAYAETVENESIEEIDMSEVHNTTGKTNSSQSSSASERRRSAVAENERPTLAFVTPEAEEAPREVYSSSRPVRSSRAKNPRYDDETAKKLQKQEDRRAESVKRKRNQERKENTPSHSSPDTVRADSPSLARSRKRPLPWLSVDGGKQSGTAKRRKTQNTSTDYAALAAGSSTNPISLPDGLDGDEEEPWDLWGRSSKAPLHRKKGGAAVQQEIPKRILKRGSRLQAEKFPDDGGKAAGYESAEL